MGLTFLVLATAVDLTGAVDGRSAALADMRRGRPAKLYVYEVNTEVSSWVTPGLMHCEPGELESLETANPVFVALPEADFSEGIYYDAEDRERRRSAIQFGEAYNRTVLRTRRDEVLRPQSRM